MNKSSRSILRKKRVRLLASLFLLLAVIAVIIVSVFFPASIKKLYLKLNAEDLAEYTEQFSFNLHFIDVGKADCILIQADGHNILVDSGTADSKNLIFNYLNALGITQLDAAINTHPDKDHYGSFKYLLKRIPFKVFYVSPADSDSATFDDLTDALVDKAVATEFLSAGDTLNYGDLSMELIAPIKAYEDSNSMSLVMRCTYHDFVFLLTGDMTENEISDILDSGADVGVNLLKVSHHGSRNGTTEKLLEAADPDYSVVCCGQNSNNLPSTDTIKLLENSGTEILNTEDKGNIIFSLDALGTLKIKTEY